MLTQQHSMELLSRAYIQAIAGQARLNLSFETKREFDYGVDGTFHHIKEFNGRLVESGFPLDFQIKASTDWRSKESHIIFNMEAIAYNKIVDRNTTSGAIPKILILLCLPTKTDEWLESTEEYLLLRKCCYWERLGGKLTSNKKACAVHIPRTQRLTTESLIELLGKVRQGLWR